MWTLGGQLSTHDQTLFLWHTNHELVRVLVSYVDDVAYYETQEIHEIEIKPSKKTFRIGSQASLSFKLVGLNVGQHVDEIKIDQAAYLEDLKSLNID